jgi:hypothetical protein
MALPIIFLRERGCRTIAAVQDGQEPSMTTTREASVEPAGPEEPVEAPRKSRKNNPEKTRENILQAPSARKRPSG